MHKGSAPTGCHCGYSVPIEGTRQELESQSCMGTFSSPHFGPGCLLPSGECLPRTQVPLAFNYNIRIIKLFCEHSLLLMQLPGALAFIERKVVIYYPLYAQKPSSLSAQDRAATRAHWASPAASLMDVFPGHPWRPSGTRMGWREVGKGCCL